MKVKVLAMLPMALVLGFAVAAFVAVMAAAPPVNAQEQNESQNEEEEQQDHEEESGVTYQYVAQPGDSYSKIARKAVQTYGLKHEVKLSQAQIIFAETNLTLEAGAPLLNQGQSITISESKIGEWVKKAQDLNDDQKAAWQKYTVGVNFNTNSVGENS